MAYTVTLDPQGGWTTMPSVTFNGTSMPDVAIPYRDYYTFNGYYDQANGAGTQYFTSAGIAARSWDKGADATLYASWTDATPSGTRRTVTLNKDGGTGGTDGPIYGYSGYKLPYIQPPTKSLYMFDGYYYGTTKYIDAQGAPTRTFNRSSNTTLKAQWEPLPVWYTVTFDTNGGFIIPDNEKTYEYQVGKTYSSQKNFPPSSFAWRQPNGTWAASRRWGGRGGQSWTYNWENPTTSTPTTITVSGQDFGSWSNPYRYSPWEDLAAQCLIGWFDAPVGGNQINASDVCALTKDTTLYAHWNFTTATFKFDAQGGEFEPGVAEVTASFDLSYGRPFGRLPTPTRSGYCFQGWYTLPKGKTLDDQCRDLGYTDVYSIDDDIWLPYNAGYVAAYKAEPRGGRKVIAADHFDPEPYYAPEYGSTDPNRDPLYGPKAGFFVALEKSTYRLLRLAVQTLSWNWLSVGAPETGDAMTLPILYAHWTNGLAEVALNDQGGTGGSGIATVGSGGVLPAVTPPTKSGYNFLGYYQFPNGGGVKYYNADGTAASAWTSTADGEVIAAWEAGPAATITVSFGKCYAYHYDNRDAASAVMPSPMTAEVGKPYGTLPTVDITGHDFYGWCSNPSAIASDIGSATIAPSSNVTLYALWYRRVYQISYETFGFAITIAETDRTYVRGAAKLLAVVRTAPDGYTFGGWYESPDFSGSPIASIPDGALGDKRVYAKWSPIMVTVSFNANYEGGVNPSSVTISRASAFGTLPTMAERTGYVFGGWFTAASGGSEVLAENRVEMYTSSASANTLALYAHWREQAAPSTAVWGYVKYRLRLETNGGTVAAAYGELKYVAGHTKTLPTAAQVTKSGATFGGWYETEDFSGSAVTEIPDSATGTKKFYAKWT